MSLQTPAQKFEKLSRDSGVADDPGDWSEFFAERNLWEVYKQSAPFYRTRFNQTVVGVAAALLTVFLVERFFSAGGRLTVSFTTPRIGGFDLAVVFANWASAGISYAATLLGFLLAGFAVLFAVLQRDTATRLRQITRPG